jgi:hypothetical protein
MIQNFFIIIKVYFMPNTKTDNNNYSTQGNDQQRDLGAKGGLLQD